MGYSFYSCSVYDTKASLFLRTTSLVSHHSSIALHSIALSTAHFRFAFITHTPKILISSKFSWRISCEAIPEKQSLLNPQIKEQRERRHNAMEFFLLQECCLSSSEIALLVSSYPRLFRIKSLDRSHHVVQMFKDRGFTTDEVKNIILRNPGILTNPSIYIKSKLDYLITLGMAEEDVKNIVFTHPITLTYSLNRNLVPKILFLTKIFGSKANLFTALRKAPGLLATRVELVNDRLKVLEDAGLRKREIEQIIEKVPRFLCCSPGKIQKNMEFLTCSLGFKPNVVAMYPILIDFSVEKRMRPRHKVLQYLHSLGVGNGVITVQYLKMSEKKFTRFLSDYPQVEMLYKKYKGKTVDVEVPELLPTHQI